MGKSRPPTRSPPVRDVSQGSPAKSVASSGPARVLELQRTVGNQTTLSVPNVPFGNYIVRVRGRNALGVGQFSNAIIVVVGVVLGTGDLQVTLTWNTTVDMDLHVIEPNGAHVYYASRNGVTARLDVDDTNGFGPENIFVGAAGAQAGTYQF